MLNNIEARILISTACRLTGVAALRDSSASHGNGSIQSSRRWPLSSMCKVSLSWIGTGMLRATSCSPVWLLSSISRPAWRQHLLKDHRAGSASACLLFPDARPTLSTLRASGRKLGLVTNGSARMQRAKLTALALLPMLNTLLLSDVEGGSKPQREIFIVPWIGSTSLHRAPPSWATTPTWTSQGPGQRACGQSGAATTR